MYACSPCVCLPVPPPLDCVLIVTDDMRYEGLESLVLILELVEEQPGVMLRANRDRAVIHISDHEDGK